MRCIEGPSVAALVLTGAACGCLAPPAVLEAEVDSLEQALARFPPGTELVETEAAAGHRLRGLFVPAEAGAPVVLHFMDAGNSCAGPKADLGEACAQLVDLGWASLVFDYSGVGLSTGECAVDNLRADARAAWEEALSRAGGDPGRVIVRGISLGTIAAALLLEMGARPAATIWIAPVFPATVAARFARQTLSPAMGLLVAVLYRPVADIELDGVLARAEVPALVLTSDEDELTSREERAGLERAVRRAGGRLALAQGQHILLAGRARWLYAEELALYRGVFTPAPSERVKSLLARLEPEIAARFPVGSEARARLEALATWHGATPPEWVAACALSNPTAEAGARLLWLLRRRPYPELPFDTLVQVLSLDDPAGALPIDAIETCSLAGDLARRFGGPYLDLGPELLVDKAHARGTLPSITFHLSLGLEATVRDQPRGLWEELRERLASDAEAVRQYVRVALRAKRIPDRLVGDGAGGFGLEYRDEQGDWIALDLRTGSR
jgi:pimeloyl-ACP methyl ester carboxylesterase